MSISQKGVQITMDRKEALKQVLLPKTSTQLKKVVRDPQFHAVFDRNARDFHYIKTYICLFLKLYLLNQISCTKKFLMCQNYLPVWTFVQYHSRYDRRSIQPVR